MMPRTSIPIPASTVHPVRAVARALILGVAVWLVACQPSPPKKSAASGPPPAKSAAPEVVAPRAPAESRAAMALPSTELPPGPIYLCDVGGTRTPLELAPSVDALCRRHPEMGPCQYERNACRRRGGRVYTSIGEEVTAGVEAEYDRKVRRVTFQSDGAPAKK
jgi:hypothetical protein